MIVALVGRPNTGKTTLFNALTGLRQRVANFPGCTVEKAAGTLTLDGVDHECVDLPGTFSLLPDTSDEAVAFDFLAQTPPENLRTLCVCEASNLSQDLPLALGLKACGYPVAIVVNMIDEAAENGVAIDASRLASETGLPVALVSARHGQGLERLRELLRSEERCAEPPLAIPHTPRLALKDIEERERRRAREICGRVVRRARTGLLSTVERSISMDRWLFHPVAGPVVLMAVMFLVFQSLFAWAQPAMELIEGAFGGAADLVRPLLSGSPLAASLVCDGIIAGMSAVFVFVPQIAILFTLIGFLEHSGYLPRAGAMVDRALRPFGLDGKVFIPFLSSFACAIPGVMAARTIPNERKRLSAILLCPLMTCSARLPVYTLLIAAFVPAAWAPLGLSGRALVMAGMYVFGAAVALLLALALRAFGLTEAQGSALTVLPPYRLPKPRELGRYVWTRVWHFLGRAGQVIFMVSLLLWALGTFPRAPEGATPSQQMEQSLLGRAGRAIEPVFRPLGYDWKISVGVLSSVAAREVFVGTMGSLLALSGDTSSPEELAPKLQERYGLPVGVSLLIFFALALQCVSTISVVRRETGGWKWPLLQLGFYTVLAYSAAFAGYRLALLLSA